MTRETKVGLIIAGSFLCLVCIVVASKMRRGEPSMGEEEPHALREVQKKGDSTPSVSDKEKTPAAPVPSPQAAAISAENKKPQTDDAPKSFVLPDGPPPHLIENPSARANDLLKKQQEQLMVGVNKQSPIPMPLPIPPKAGDAGLPVLPDQGPLPPLSQPFTPQIDKPMSSPSSNVKGNNPDPVSASAAPPPGPIRKDGAGNAPPPEIARPANVVIGDLPPLAPIKKDTANPSAPSGIAPATKQESTNSLNTQVPVGIPPALPDAKQLPNNTASLPNFAPMNGKEAPPAFPMNQVNAQNVINKEVPPAVVIAPSPKNVLNESPPPGFPMDTKRNGNLPVGNPSVIKSENVAKENPTIPPPPTAAPNDLLRSSASTATPLPKIATSDLPSAPTIAVNQNQGIGNLPSTTPPNGASNFKPLPPVKVYEPELYVCAQSDSTFAQLSQRFYGSDKYSDALLAYNRDHHGVIKQNADFLMTNPPTLQTGQQVLKPDRGLLERDYRLQIKDEAPGTIAPVGGTVPPVRISPPASALPKIGSPSGSDIPTITSSRNVQSSSVPSSYVVQSPGGENIRDIAQRCLGDANLWHKIYRLNQSNPSVQPQFPIPAGTNLRLPTN